MKTPLPRCIIATLAIALACLIHQAAGQTGQVLDYKTQNVTAAGITFCAQYYTLSYQLWCTGPVTSLLSLQQDCNTTTPTACPAASFASPVNSCVNKLSCDVRWPGDTGIQSAFCLVILASSAAPTTCDITLQTGTLPRNADGSSDKWATWQIVVTAVVCAVGFLSIVTLTTVVGIACASRCKCCGSSSSSTASSGVAAASDSSSSSGCGGKGCGCCMCIPCCKFRPLPPQKVQPVDQAPTQQQLAADAHVIALPQLRPPVQLPPLPLLTAPGQLPPLPQLPGQLPQLPQLPAQLSQLQPLGQQPGPAPHPTGGTANTSVPTTPTRLQSLQPQPSAAPAAAAPASGTQPTGMQPQQPTSQATAAQNTTVQPVQPQQLAAAGSSQPAAAATAPTQPPAGASGTAAAAAVAGGLPAVVASRPQVLQTPPGSNAVGGAGSLFTAPDTPTNSKPVGSLPPL